MLTIIIFGIIGLITSIIKYKSKDRAGQYMIWFIGFWVGGLLGYLVAWALPMETYDKEYSYNIETLQDNSSINGSFFLGSGYFEGTMKYVFYYEENGYYKMKQLNHDRVSIKYTNDKPRFIIIEKTPTNSYINYFAIDEPTKTDVMYIIEVPKGTIKNDYNLDAK